MNIFVKFEHLNDLTESELKIIDYIKENPERFIKENVNDISVNCYVSSSSIYRFCSKVGCNGLSELKVQISSSINDYLQRNSNFNYDYPVKANETQYQIVHKLKEVYDQTVISSLNILDLEQLRLSVSMLKKAKHIDIYTSAGNIYFAQNFQFQMQEIGVHVNVPIEEYSQRLTAACSNKDHVAIVISFGGRGLLVSEIIHTLKLNHTPIILITTPHSPIEKYGNYVLYMNPYENHYNKISSFSTRLSLLYVLDSIYTCYFELDYDENKKKKINYYHYIINKSGGKI